MAGLENTLRECLLCLKSPKATEKKKGAENLKNHLEQEDAIRTINKHSIESDNSTICWNSIFKACHHALLQAADKIHKDDKTKSRPSLYASKLIHASLVETVTSKASCDVRYLDCNIVIEASLEVLENTAYKNIIGHRYLILLNEFILSSHKYLGKIKSEYWNDLYSISLKLMEEPLIDSITSDILLLLNVTIRYGCECSSLVFSVKKNIFGFLDNCVKVSLLKNDNYQLKVLKLLVTVCEKLQKECRIAVCKFGEETIENILQMYPIKTKALTETKEMIFDFLLIIVKAHHPNGADGSSSAAYAHDWKIWKEILSKINCLALAEIRNVLGHDKRNMLWPGFLNLMVEVYKQIFHSGGISVNVTTGRDFFDESALRETSTRKKIRVTSGLPDLIDHLNDVNQFIDMWPWLCIIHRLLETYPALVNETHYIMLLKNIAKFLSASKESLVTDYLCKCFIPLINIRRNLRLSDSDLHDEEPLLESIRQTVLRTIGLNFSTEWSHRLLQHMFNNEWIPSMGNAILKLYLSGVIHLSDHSLMSLYVLRQRISFPNSLLEISVWYSLLNWMFPENWTKRLSQPDVELYAHMVILICLKNQIKNKYVPIEALKLEISKSKEISADDMFELTSYESKLFLKEDSLGMTSSNDVANISNIANEEALEQLFHLLELHCNELCDGYNNMDDMIEAFQCLSRACLLILHIEKFLTYYEIDSMARLTELRNTLISQLVEMTKNALNSKSTNIKLKLLPQLSEFFKQLGILPLTLVDCALNDFYDNLKFLFEIIEAEESIATQDEFDTKTVVKTDNVSLFDINILSEKEKLIVEACNVIVYFCYNYEQRSSNQYRVFVALLEKLHERSDKLSSLCLLQMATMAINAGLKMKNIDSNIMMNVTIALQALCDPGEWYMIEESAIVILKFIQQGIRTVEILENQSAWDNLEILVNGIEQETLSYGSGTITEVVQCFGLLLKVAKFKKYKSNQELFAISVKLLNYLKHGFHEVRMTATRFVSEIFTVLDLSYKNIQPAVDKEELFITFKDLLFVVFIVQDSLSEEEIDENVNRPMTVLYSLASVLCCSQSVRREALFLLFCITYEKRLNRDLSRKILTLVKIHLKLDSVMHFVKDHSLYLLWNWYRKYETFENFPFQVLQCTRDVDFYEIFLQDIIPILLFYGKVDNISEMAVKFGISLSELTQKCFAEIMALLLRKIIDEESEEGMTAAEMHSYFENSIESDQFKDLMVEKLAYILIALFRGLHDTGYEIPPKCILPSPAPFRSNESEIFEAINHLQSTTEQPDSPLIVFISCCYQDHTQKIIQQLFIDVMNASTPEIKLESFQKYAIFCQLLLPYYDDLLKSHMVVFIARTVTFNLLHFLSEDRNQIDVSMATLQFFHKFISNWLTDDENKKIIVSLFDDMLSTIVGKLVSLALVTDELGLEALSLLQVLLNDKSEYLTKSIQDLEPFPDLAQFQALNGYYIQLQDTQTEDTTLINDIRRFLKVETSSYSICRVESLKFLKKQLSQNKDDLNQLFKGLAFSRGFSEQCATSLPHQLICSLLQMTNSVDQKVRYEAACCLGEVGLVDLHTLVLKPNCDVYDEDFEAEVLITTKLCRMLKDCITDENVNLVTSAAATLYATLSSHEGYTVGREKLSKMDKLLMLPFIDTNKPTVPKLWTFFDADLFRNSVDIDSLWFPETITFNGWITNLVCSIFNCFRKPCFLNLVSNVCRIKYSLAEELFKYLIYLLLNGCYTDVKDVLSNRVNTFFKNHFTSEDFTDSYTSTHSRTVLPDVYHNKQIIQSILDVIHFIRLKQEEPNVNDLKINYLYVAKAAQYCSLYFTSVLYCELWINFQIQECGIENDGNVLSVLEEIGNQLPDEKIELLNILREAFSKIGDSDALYGCGSSLLLQTDSRILHYVQTENWTRVMESCDILNSRSFACSTTNYLSSALGLAGFDHLRNQYLSSLPNLNVQLKDDFYESGWKLGKWDLPEPNDDEKTFGYYQYAALKDIQQKNFTGAQTHVISARKMIIPSLALTGLESTKNVYRVLSKLQCLQDIDDYLRSTDVEEIVDAWRSQDEMNSRMNFKYKEIVLSQRTRIVELENETACDFVLNIAKLARKENNFNYANACLALIKHNNAPVSNIFEMKMILEEAKVLWSRKETHVARYMLKNLLKRVEVEAMESFYSKLLRIYGSWLSEINLENADVIFNDYFKPAITKITYQPEDNRKERKSRIKTFKCVGEFADSQYQQITKYIKSDDFQRRQRSVQEARIQSNALDGVSIDVRKTKMQLSNQSKIDDLLVTEICEKRNRYLLLAMNYYLQLLTESENEELAMFRVISLWLENKHHAELNSLMKKHLVNIPSYKFIVVLPQLMAHITRNHTEGFGRSLNMVIEKCTLDHPHHTLPLILSLAKYLKDEEYGDSKNTGKFAKEERVLAAIEYIKKFRITETIGEIVTQMETLSDAYIQFAYYDIGKTVKFGEMFNIRSAFLIAKLKNIDKALCPTITLPVSRIAQYNDIIGIQRIESKFMSVGGINTPKKINCICTDGVIRHQLVKGRDDIRQDAVMQQVFTIMNKLLSENKHTSKRKLSIRTYKVVPLSQRSGVLEWCTNTMSFSDYLAYRSESKPGAHKRYRPQDLSTLKAREMLMAAKNKSDEEKLKVYKNICKNLKPVFRYFFLEKFPSPTMWFERKLAYIHSVAVTSIVGYIIGLGDRHVQNMLIDEKTAEVIHIDFGVAFDQGLLLFFPERIPFRLTRDIEDGMGVFSIDGIFRNCCEQTLAVMRENKNVIQTIVEVFLYDPLYQWTVTPEKKAMIQSTTRKSIDPSTSVTEVNVTAPRALAGVISKLQGLEEGTYTTIEGQVNRLIQQAKDPYNLARLFSGWQAYL